MLPFVFLRGDPKEGAIEESTVQKLPDLGRCLNGQGLNDGENTMKGDDDSLSREPFSCNEDVDGVGDLIDMDCNALFTRVGESAILLPLIRCNDPSFVLSSLELMAVKVVAVKRAFVSPKAGLPSVETIVCAPRFLPRLDTEQLVGEGEILVRLGMVFLGCRRKPPVHGKGGTLSRDDIFDLKILLLRDGFIDITLPHILSSFEVCSTSSEDCGRFVINIGWVILSVSIYEEVLCFNDITQDVGVPRSPCVIASIL